MEYTIDASYDNATLTFCAAKLNPDRFETAYNTIQSNGTFQLETFNETSLSGKIKINNANAFVFTSIPYDKSWSVYVDGEKLSYSEDAENKVVAVGGGLIGFSLTRGEHTVEMRYNARGLRFGMLLSFAGIMICALLLLVKILVYVKNKKELSPAEQTRPPQE